MASSTTRAIATAALMFGATLPAFAEDKKPAAAAGKKVTYDDDVRAIFRIRCFSCHNQNMAKSDLALDAYNTVMQGGASGAAVVGGDLKKSRLWQLVNHLDMPKMPPEQDKLPAAELATIQSWIEEGALQNAGAAAATKTMVDLSATAGSARPTGAPPMPGRMLKEPVTLAQRSGAVTALAASPWAPLVAVAGVKQILLYNSDNAELLGVLPFPEGQAHVLKFSRSGTLLMAGGGRAGLLGKVVVFDVKSGKRVAEVGDELDVVLAADINDNHTMIALGGPRKIVRVYAVKDGSLIHEIKKHTDWIYAIEFSPDGVLLATGDRASGLFVWESETAREYLALRGHAGAVTDVSWRLDSNLLASSGEDGAIRLWESQNGGQVRAWGAHGGGTASVRFTHDGRLVSTGRDRVTKVWDGNGAQQKAFEAQADIGLKACFTHDGKRVVAGDWTGEIRLWDVADGKRVANLSMNPPTLAVQLETATKSLTAQQVEQQKLTVASQAAQSAVEKAQADLAAAQKAVTTAQGLVGATAAAAAAGKAALAQATTIQAAAAKATADFEALFNAAKAGAAAAQAAAAKAPQDKNLADQAARLNTELEIKTAQLDPARKVTAEKTAALEKAKQVSAEADKATAAAAAAVAPAQQKVAALTPALKPVQDAAAAAKAKSDAAAAAVTAAQQSIERLKQDIAFAQQAKVARK